MHDYEVCKSRLVTLSCNVNAEIVKKKKKKKDSLLQSFLMLKSAGKCYVVVC